METNNDSEKRHLLDDNPQVHNKHIYTSLGSIQDSSTEEEGRGRVVQTEGQTDSAAVAIKLYYRRYYILFVFSLMAIVQGLDWNTWSPISQSAKRVFHWTDRDIALLASWGPLSYVISVIPFSWLINRKGLRVSCLVCSLLLAGGAGFRCITQQQPYANWLIHTGQIWTGLGGPVAMAGCTIISSVWFPSNERTTATSIAAMCNAFGVALSFLIGPLLVPQHNIDCNMTLVYNNSDILPTVLYLGNGIYNGCDNTTEIIDILHQERRDVMKLQYVEFGIASVVFLIVLLYFPAKPPHPPSVTASVNRAGFKAGITALVKNRHFWIVSSIYGLSIGMENTWLSVLDINFHPLGVTQNEAGWLGFYTTLAGTLGAITVARFADAFAKHMKAYLLVLYIGSLAAFAWVALMFIQVAPFRIDYLYIAVILGGLCLNSSVPLLYELSCEITFPVSEGVTSGALTMLFNFTAGVFLYVMMIPNIGDSWTTWCVPGTIAGCIPLLLIVREKYNRLDMDIEVEQPETGKNKENNN